MMKFKQLAIEREEDLYFGTARYPVTTRRGLVIGGVRFTRNLISPFRQCI